MLHKKACALVALSLLIAGCTNTGPLDDNMWPEQRPLGQDMEAIRPSRSTANDTSVDSFNEPAGSLSLRDALAAALLRSPDLAAVGYEVRVREAEALQAGILPNPELIIKFENFGGTGQVGSFDSLKTTLALSQVIELGGKRLKRRRVAQYSTQLAGWEYEIRRIDVLSKTTADYVGLLAAERRLRIANETLQLAQRLYNVVGERVDAGKVSPVDRTKARVELAQTELAHEQADRAVKAARFHLAANWGSTKPLFTHLTGNLIHTDSPPTLESILERVEQNPDIARWAAESAYRQAEIELALAQRVPNISLTGGVRHYNDIDEVAFVAGLSLPLPIFDNNKDGIQATRLRSLKGDKLSESARVRVRTAVVETYLKYETAYISVRTTQDQILPGAKSAFEAAEEAFRQGKIGALDLLDSERTLFNAHRQLTDALITYHLAIISAERLIGAPLHETDYTKGNK